MPRDRSSSRSHRHRSYNSPDMRQVSSDDRTLPVPNTYSEHKRGEKRSHGNSKMSRHIKPAGESGRKGFHPIHFSKISFRSTSRASLLCNFLWPFVPAAIAVRCKSSPTISYLLCRLGSRVSDAMPDNHITIFALAYIAMVPCANLIGFAGQELSRKLPHVLGVLLEITYVPHGFKSKKQ